MATRTTLALAALCLTLPLASCGGGGGDPASLTNDGYASLGSGDHQGALESFEKALAGLDANAPEYMRAKMGEIEALTHLDADRAKDALLGLGDRAGESEYSKVASNLTVEGHFMQAIDVLDAGVKKYGESPKLKALLDKVKAEAEKSGSSDALDKLKGLGYL
jgi:hypothetical protein